MPRERLFQSLILALVGLAAFAFLRPSSPDPTEDARAREAWFFTTKAHQTSRYDGVIVGDSRGLRGLSPEAMSRHLPSLDILNFCFNAGGMNREMYGAAEGLLAPDSPERMIILAPTALSFIGIKRSNAQFHEYLNKPRDLVWLYKYAPYIADWFQPVSPAIYVRKILDLGPPLLLYQVFHEDGWIETDQTPNDDLSDLTIHRDRLIGNIADAELIQDFMDQTSEWTARGIRVFGLFVPAYPPRVAMEDSLLGFDRDGFIESFSRAGGVWLDISQDGYESYDGSHLVSASAREVSDILGSTLARELAAQGLAPAVSR